MSSSYELSSAISRVAPSWALAMASEMLEKGFSREPSGF